MKKFFLKKLNDNAGYSLIEILVVLVIVSVLMMIAIPVYQTLTTRAKQAEAKTQLRFLHTLQEAHKLEYDTYASSLSELGFQQSKLINDDGTARFEVSISEATQNSYKGLATSIVDFDGDGQLNVWMVSENGKIVQTVED